MNSRRSFLKTSGMIAASLGLSGSFTEKTIANPAVQQKENDHFNKMLGTKWMHDRFGMWIHWGLYAIPARGEWVRNHERISVEAYQKYFDEFNPTEYDPREWARIAKGAGMKYGVMTAKHHDGFCLFDSKLTDYKSTKTQCKRDLIREYVDAFRAEGLGVGLYYSLLDWHHEDYPHYGDGAHPDGRNPAYKDKTHHFDNYLQYMHGQVRELLTDYGKIDVMYFDYSYGEMTGEKWKATELINMMRTLQPDIIINNRLEVSGERLGSLMTANPLPWAGDYVTPEGIIPPRVILNEEGERVPWEVGFTLNDHWGYCEADRNYKTPARIIRTLVECVSKGGNMLLNAGPDAKGKIPEEQIDIFEEVGKWMKRNGESIYGCDYAGVEKPDYGRVTRNGNKLYYHVMESTLGALPLYGFKKGEVKKVRILDSDAELPFGGWGTKGYDDEFVTTGGDFIPSDKIDTVVVVEI